MGRGTWYYSLGVSSIIDAFVRVDDRSYLLSGATNSSEANGIIRNPKLELESFCFTFDLVPLSCGKRLYCLVGRKDGVMDTRSRFTAMRFWVNQCTSSFHGVNEPEDMKEEKMYHEVFPTTWKLSRCGKESKGNGDLWPLTEGATSS
ncbi:hypothetical protein Tco_1112519 [Tanacetum coccineum]|uniref:Uncharacterized protein n=1 Tax=Tanacetum coccineum TaxID=301880 RepID=A0ABQ5IQV2_9ASTR